MPMSVDTTVICRICLLDAPPPSVSMQPGSHLLPAVQRHRQEEATPEASLEWVRVQLSTQWLPCTGRIKSSAHGQTMADAHRNNETQKEASMCAGTAPGGL